MKRNAFLPIAIFAALVFVAAPALDAQTLVPENRGLNSDSVLDRQRVVSAPRNGSFKFSDAEINAFERKAFGLINQRRSELGLSEMAWSDDAAKVARLHSNNMAKLQFFGHAGADGKMVDERADQLGVKRWKAIGENIAFMRGFDDPCATAVEKWMLSTGHRSNLLNPRWQESAIGIAVTEDGTYYFTQVFLERR